MGVGETHTCWQVAKKNESDTSPLPVEPNQGTLTVVAGAAGRKVFLVNQVWKII